MKNQILKAIKDLKTFIIEDIELITDYEESEILEVINNLGIQETDGVYYFEKQQKDALVRKSKTGKNILLKNFSQKYLDTLSCSQKTINSYQSYLRLHILPFIGNKRIVDIKSQDIIDFQQVMIK
jgi:hypothetical protein